MSFFDSVKKIVVGNVAHGTTDSGNPVKIGGKGNTTAPAAADDGDRVDASFDRSGRLRVLMDSTVLDAVSLAPLAAGFGILAEVEDRSNANGANTTNTTMDRLRLGREQQVVVMPDIRWAFASKDSVTNAADILVSTTNAYNGYAAPTVAFFDGADAGFGAAARFVRIPLLGFSRGATVSLVNTLGVALNVKVRADIAGVTSSLAGMRPLLASFDVSNGATLVITPFPSHETADAAIQYVPQLLMPMFYLTLELTPASDPSAGGIYLMAAR